MLVDDGYSIVTLTSADLDSDDLMLLTDKAIKQLFSYEKEEWKKLIASKSKVVVSEKEPRSFYTVDGERKTISKSVAEITIKVKIKPGTDETIMQNIINNPLNNFDKLVLSACLSHQFRGKQYITVQTIFKYFGGTRQPDVKMHQSIEDSIDKLRFIEVKMDVTQAYCNLRRLQKPDGTPIRKFKSVKKPTLMDYLSELDSDKTPLSKEKPHYILSDYLLPARTLTAEVNGIRTTAIQLYSVSPLFIYAEDKNETALLESKLLKPKLSNTQMNVCLKMYLLMRIKAMIRSKKGGGKSLEPIILFDSIYNNCGDPEKVKTDRCFRKRMRETAFKYLMFLKKEKEIKDFVSLTENNKESINLSECIKFEIKFK